MAVEDDILNYFKVLGGNIIVGNFRCRIDDSEVHSVLNGIIEEHRVHGLTDVVIAPEGEREVRNASTDVSSFEVLANPPGSTDEIDSIVVVLRNTRRY